MTLRRAFLRGAAILLSIAALVAIVTVVNGSFGETEGKIFATLATTFVAGSLLVAGLACLERDDSRLLAIAGVVLACGGFVLWSAQIWGGFDSDGYWKLLGVLTAWAIALLIATTTKLMLRAPSLVRVLYPATAGAAGGAALVVTIMTLRENGDGWQLFAVLLILALLGEALAPVFQRMSASAEVSAERVLGRLDGVDVVAVRGDARSVRIGDRAVRLGRDEGVVIRSNR